MTDTSRTILSLLTPRQKRRAVLQGCLILIGMVFEAASLGAIMPVGRLFTSGSGPGVTAMVPTWLLDSYPSLRDQPLLWGLGVLLVLGIAKSAVVAVEVCSGRGPVRLMPTYGFVPTATMDLPHAAQLVATHHDCDR